MEILKGDILATIRGDVKVIGAAELDDLIVVTRDLNGDDDSDMFVINEKLEVQFNYSDIKRIKNA